MGYTPHVLVVGGGVVGTAIARDLALRGLDVTLVERGHLASGATGTNPGILGAGSRFATADPERATRCLREHRTLSHIAEHCVEETGGLVVAHAADSREAFERTVEACRECGIPTEHLTDGAVLGEYPSLADDVEEALRVPAAVVDPFRLTVANARGAAEYGATIRTHTTVTDVLVSDGSVAGVEVRHDPPPHPPSDPVETPSSAEGGDSEQADESVDDGSENDESVDDGPENDESVDDGSENDESVDDGSENDESVDDGPENDESGDDASGEDRVGEEGADVDETESDRSTDGGEPALVPDRQVPGTVSSEEDVPTASTSDKQVPGTTSGSGAGGATSGSAPARSSSGAAGRSTSASGTLEEVRADFVVNAAGPWAPQVAERAGFDIGGAYRATGLAVVAGGGPGAIVRRPDGDRSGGRVQGGDSSLEDGGSSVAVPFGDHTVLGTVVDAVAGPDHALGRTGIVDPLLDDLATVVPTLGAARPLRTFRGVRWMPDETAGNPYVDHGARDDCWGMVTVTGGTLTTHRRVAEQVTDHVCQQFGILRECQTDEMSLPGSDGPIPAIEELEDLGLERSVLAASRRRLGSRTTDVLTPASPVICDCQGVTQAEVRDALVDETAHENDVHAVRVRTGATMGACQGGQCSHRLAGELFPEADADTVADALADLMADRWAGHRETLWGGSMVQAKATYRFHATTLHRNSPFDADVDLDAFDDGPDEGEDDAERRGYGGYPI